MKIFNCLLLFGIINYGHSQSQTFEIDIWNGKIPNSIENMDYKERKVFEDSSLVKIEKVTAPTLTIYKPKSPNRTAVLIFPGGGYEYLSINKEGHKVAAWLNTLGITAIVVKYRLPSDEIMSDKTIGPLQDAQEAIRLVKRNAKKWNIDSDKIGTIGFSAGGHLAASLSTRYNDQLYPHDETSAKPAFSILVYPVISMHDDIAHLGSKTNLLGVSVSSELIERFSCEKQVDSTTPPHFLVHATDDKSVPVQNSIAYYLALKINDIPSEMHLYATGGHGFGLGKAKTSKYWTKQCQEWLSSNHFLD